MEATREEDAEKNRLCPPTPDSSTLADWAHRNVPGARATRSLGLQPDIKSWGDSVALNPARISLQHSGSGRLDAVFEHLPTHLPPGLARLAELGGRTTRPSSSTL